MTIIAYDGKRLCADKAVYKGGIHVYDREKIKVYEGDNLKVVFALSGDLSIVEAKELAIKNYLHTEKYTSIPMIVKDLNFILRDPDNILDGIIIIKMGYDLQVYQLNNVRLLRLISHQPYVAGNADGQLVAMGALYHGAPATEAVAIACRLLNLAQCNDPNKDLTTVEV